MRDDEPLSKYGSLDRLGRRLASEPVPQPRGLRRRRYGAVLAVAAALIVGGVGGAAVAGLTDLFDESPSLEERYIELLETEREGGLCREAIEAGEDSPQCKRILRDLEALDSGTYVPKFGP